MRNIRRRFNYNNVYEFMKKNGLRDMTFKDGIKVKRYNDRMDIVTFDGKEMDFRDYCKLTNWFADALSGESHV